MEQQTPTDGVKLPQETPAQKVQSDKNEQQARVDFAANAQPVADALRQSGNAQAAKQLEEVAKALQPEAPTKAPAMRPKASMNEERDEFVKNAQPVADALRKTGREQEAKQLEAAAKVIGSGRNQAQEQPQAVGKVADDSRKGTLKDVLDNIWDVIDKDPNLRNMPQAKNLRAASNKLAGAGLLDLRVQDGLIMPFISNFATNFEKQAQGPGKREEGVERQLGPKPKLEQPPTSGQQVASPAAQAKPEATIATEAKISAGTPANGITVQTRDSAGQEVKTSVASGEAGRGTVAQVVTATQAAAQAQQPTVATPRQEAPVPNKPSQAPEQTPANPTLAFTRYAPTPETGVIENRKTVGNPMDQLNVGITATGQFGVNPQVNQERLIGDGMKAMEKFFDYQMPIGPHKLAKVGLAEPGQLEQTAEGWKVVKKGQLELTDTAGNVFRPQQQPSAPAQQAALVHEEKPAPVNEVKPAFGQGKAFTSQDIPFAALAALGMKGDDLQKSGQLQALLDGKKTTLLPTFATTNGAGESVPFQARLQLVRDEKGVVDLRVETPKQKLEIPKQLLGNNITPAMKEQLEQRGVVPLSILKDGRGDSFKGWIAVDKEMKTVVTVREETVAPIREVMGVQLNAAQQRRLLSGEPTRLDGLKRENGELVSATAQLDPVQRKVTFSKPELLVVKQQEEIIQAPPKTTLKVR